MRLIDGKSISKDIKFEIKNEVLKLKQNGILPALAVILVGDDKASATYVANKEKACLECEIRSVMHKLPQNTSQEELLALIEILNLDDSIDGILVQLPLPNHINTNEILKAIDYKKDVDGFHAINVGKLASGLDGFVPCTPLGILELLKRYEVNLSGINACVVGRSNIVGKPMANLLINEGATTTICHSKTKNLSDFTKNSELIIVAVGRANFLKADMVSPGAIVIDVGINRDESGKLVGDVKFDEVSQKASLITPVPGGVGPMTIAMLLSNTLKSAKSRANL